MEVIRLYLVRPTCWAYSFVFEFIKLESNHCINHLFEHLTFDPSLSLFLYLSFSLDSS